MKSDFNCSQQELYVTARAGIQSFRDNLAEFEDFSGIYTTQWADNLLAKIAAAELLPDAQARSAESEVQRVNLAAATDALTELWQRLKRYITKGFPEAELKIRLGEAGANYYNKAANYNWDAVLSLGTTANNFITNHLAALTANNNMPAGFAATFSTAAQNVPVLYADYIQLEEQKTVDTALKSKANNEIYKTLMTMFLDGQEIFKKDEPLKKQFVFDEVLRHAGGKNTTGFKGLVFSNAHAMPIEGVLVEAENHPYSKLTDEDGHFEFNQIAADTYTFHISKPGFDPITTQVVLATGVTKTQNFKMNALASVGNGA